MAKYKHLEIIRESRISKYRFHANTKAPRPPLRDFGKHGQKLKTELDNTLENIVLKRKDIGIQSENLLVLELISDALAPDILEEMLNKFKLYLVEEEEIPNTNNSKLIIQFENEDSLNEFNKERELWESDSKINSILTYAKRRELFRAIENIREVSKNDRLGIRLKKYLETKISFLTEFFIVNIDVWFNGEYKNVIEIENQIKQVLGTGGSKLLGDLFEIPSLLLGRVLVNDFTLNALLSMDIIALVDLPFSSISNEPYELYNWDYNPLVSDELDDSSPLATILDSGIFTGNPLLKDVVVAEEMFDVTEDTPTDLNGHGTAVAGIVVYGDFNECLKNKNFKPLVRVCNGKIMHNENGRPCFPENKRPEQLIKEAIEYFYTKYNCRIFNLSVGDNEHIYNGGRQFAWAEMLDQLSKMLDIVIVVSAGNVSDPIINNFNSRIDLMEKCRDQLFFPEHRLIDPATSALSITVGSIAKFGEPDGLPNRAGKLSVGREKHPSVFTRIGKGVNKAIKPELVDYGGNFAITKLTGGGIRWMKTDRKLLEPTLNNTNENIFKGYCGTSFSAPHVTHIAARIERSLEEQFGEKPTSNLIRAVLINSARCTSEMLEWAENSADVFYTGKTNPKQDRRLRLIGYGKADDSLLYSDDTRVTLIAEDKLELRSFHLYKIPVPKEFLNVKAEKTISISLAYNPMTRLSRKSYLTNNLWFEVFRRVDEDTLLQYKAKKESGNDSEEYLNSIPSEYKAAFSPGSTEILKSTLQQRIWRKGASGGKDLLWDENEPFIFILVTGKEKFKYTEQEIPQDYALVVTFLHSGEEKIDLYNTLKNKVRIREQEIKQVERIRARG
ncbi:S8 family peptidase [Sebaldella termitidis]|uniref:S8 family peptidase n=1 Tax=Sebaldella termitidis TaxID=826 RepID=UPI003EB69EBB